jgi:hypothetical protein
MVVVVGDGLAVALVPKPLLHIYVPPPVAVIVAVCPEQIVAEDGVTTTAFTLTVS